MAHVGQEAAFFTTGRLGGHFGLAQRLRLLALGAVAHEAAETGRLPLGIGYQGNRRFGMAHRTVAPGECKFQGFNGFAGAVNLIDRIEQRLRVFLVQIGALIHAFHFIPGVSEQIAHGIIKKGVVPIDIHLVIAIGGGFHNPPIALFAAAHGLFCYLALIDGILGMGTKKDKKT